MVVYSMILYNVSGREYGPYLANVLYGSISQDPVIMRLVGSMGHILQLCFMVVYHMIL